jgi:hypothetical protein
MNSSIELEGFGNSDALSMLVDANQAKERTI